MKKFVLLPALIFMALLTNIYPAHAVPCTVSNVFFSFDMPGYLQGNGWLYKLKYDAQGNCTGANGNPGVLVTRYEPTTGAALQTLAGPMGIGVSVSLPWSFSSSAPEYLKIRSGSTPVYDPIIVSFPSQLNPTLTTQAAPGHVTLNWAFLSTSLQNHDGFYLRRSVKLPNQGWGSYIKIGSIGKNQFQYVDDFQQNVPPPGTQVRYMVQPVKRQDTNQLPTVAYVNGAVTSYPIKSLDIALQ